MRCTVVDLGSSTFHAQVADVDELGIRSVIHDRKIACRLGEDAFAAGVITRAAYERGLAAVTKLAKNLGALVPERSRVVATGVFRETSNGEAFLADASKILDAQIDLIDGREEARLTWRAVSAELAGSHGRLGVIDVGGGSLEYAAGSTTPDVAASLPLGVLRLSSLGADTIRARVAELADEALAQMTRAKLETVAISSGTARALLRLARKLELVADGQRHLWRRTIGDLARMLGPMPPAALVCLGVDRSRADTVAAGAVLLDAMLEPLGRPVAYVARGALREGVLIELASQRRMRRAAL